jgi:cytochrome c biogenesis protein CcmG/thiol:disulfide interchange protein DsbE
MRRLRWLIVPIVVVPLGWLLLSGFGRDPRAVASPLIGLPAPAWTLTTLEGETLSNEALGGRPYVINFWASWCIPECVNEHPVLAAAHEGLGEEVAIVGVLFQNAPADAEAFLARYGDAGYDHVVDEDGRLAIEFGVTGPPETYFVDAGGIVRAKQFGPLTNALMDLHLNAIGIDR